MGLNQNQSRNRHILDDKFADFMESNGLPRKNVYFSPPEDLKLKYPCIIYKRIDIRETFANNKKYKMDNFYEITLVYDDPDSTLSIDFLNEFETSNLVRSFSSNNLEHTIIHLYFR